MSFHGAGPHCIAVDRSGRLLATGNRRSGEIRIGPITGEEPHLLLGHEGGSNAIAFGPKGEWLVSAGDDHTVRLWPVPSGEPLHTLPRDDLLAKLRALTNIRAFQDEASLEGYRLEATTFDGWENLPTW